MVAGIDETRLLSGGQSDEVIDDRVRLHCRRVSCASLLRFIVDDRHLPEDFRRYAQKIQARYCPPTHGRNFMSSDMVSTPEALTVWGDQPRCQVSNHLETVCNYNHNSGKGLLVYPVSQRTHGPTLICTETASQKGSGFLFYHRQTYAIDSQCVVTQLDWHTHGNSVRSDMAAVLGWTSQELEGEPIAIPAAFGAGM